MQSNVPTPFETRGTESQVHLAMPGGQWGQGEKYISDDLQTAHHCKLHLKKTGISVPNILGVSFMSSTNNCCLQVQPFIGKQCYSTVAYAFKECLPIRNTSLQCVSQFSHFHASASREKTEEKKNTSDLNSHQKLKTTASHYGSTVMIFHISMGLVSLGFWYLIISRYVLRFHFDKCVSKPINSYYIISVNVQVGGCDS